MTTIAAGGYSRALVQYLIQPCGIAIVFVLVALIWTFPLQQIIDYPFVFLFFGAIMGSAWFGGLVAGAVSVLLSTLLVTFLFIPPFYSMSVAKSSQSFLTAFIVCAIAITVVSSARKRAESAILRARDQLEEKVRERTAELERSNREIRESERQLRLLTEAVPQQIWRASARGQIEYCNQHLLDYLGRSQQELAGEGFFAILHPEDAPLFRQGWSAALESGTNFEAGVRIRSASGEYRWFLVRSIPQRNEASAVARWYGIHIDIEEQQRAQQDLARSHDQRAHIAHTLSLAEMAASIAHELNQPLTALMSHAYACREWLHCEPANIARARAAADKIVQESARAGAVVGRVRALFRKETLPRAPVDLNALIHDTAHLLREETIRREVALRFVLAAGLPTLVLDSIQIQQVLINLAMNGMEAMADARGGRELIIRSAPAGEGAIQVSVEDRGSGIPAEVASRIFEPFFTTRPAGTGMGLAICRSIVEAHGGRIWPENLPSGGAAIHFTLPAGE